MTNRRQKNWLVAVVALQCVTLAAMYGGGPSTAAVEAQGIPDAGAQQQAIIDQLKDVNGKLDRISSILTGGIAVRPAAAPAGQTGRQ